MKHLTIEIGPRIDGETLGNIGEAVAIARDLAELDVPIVGDDVGRPGCGLCGADDKFTGTYEENITHNPTCPLARAQALVVKLRPR